MNRTHLLVRHSTAVLTLALGLVFVLSASVAQADTCSSVCNQIRRSCNHAAKGAAKAARIDCKVERAACHDGCDTNAETCPVDCQTAADACVEGCAGAEDAAACEAECGATLVQCQDDCANCHDNCDDAAGTCKTEAKAARDASRELCKGSRRLCNNTCEGPVNRDCVRDCTSDEHGCRNDAKKIEGACKKECAKDGTRGACIRTCKRQNNLDQQACEDVAVLCYAGCLGVDLTPTTTMGATTTTLPVMEP